MCLQAFSQHGAIRRGAFRHGAHGDPRLRCHESVMSQSCVSVCYVEKPYCFVAYPQPTFRPPLGLKKWAREVTKTSISRASRPIFLTTVPQMHDNTMQKRRRPTLRTKILCFAMCTFPLERNTFSQEGHLLRTSFPQIAKCSQVFMVRSFDE